MECHLLNVINGASHDFFPDQIPSPAVRLIRPQSLGFHPEHDLIAGLVDSALVDANEILMRPTQESDDHLQLRRVVDDDGFIALFRH